MKKLLFLIIVVLLFILGIHIGKKIMVDFLEIEKTDTSADKSFNVSAKERTYIDKSGEFYSDTIFEDTKANEDEASTSLVSSMTYNPDINMYYIIIKDLEVYEKFHKELDFLPELTDQSFLNYFAVIVFNEAQRSIDETDLAIVKASAIENATHITMKQKELASAFQHNNIFFATVEVSQLRDNVIIEIEK